MVICLLKMKKKMGLSRADKLIIQLSQIDEIAKKECWSSDKKNDATSKIINDWKHNEHEEHLTT